MHGRPRGACLGRTSIRCLGKALSAWDWSLALCAFLPGWRLVLPTWEVVLWPGESWLPGRKCCQPWFEHLSACINPLLGGSAVYLGRIVNCLGNSADCLGMSPLLGTSTVYLRGVVSPDCLRRSANYLGELLPAWEELLPAWETALSAWEWVPSWEPSTVYPWLPVDKC